MQFRSGLIILSIVICSASQAATGSAVLSLASGAGAAGGSVALNISQTSSGGAQPTGLQWSFSYSSDITGVTVAAGPSATNAQKTVTCATNTCVIEGMNANVIADGVVAVATFQLAAQPSSSAIPIVINGAVAASAAGAVIPGSGAGGTITLTAAGPSVPGNFTATAISSSQINLSWSASSEAGGSVAGYKVYRSGAQIATVTAGTTYSNTGLSASTAYSYTVAAYDAAGNVSAPSAAASATTLPIAIAATTTVTTNPAGLSITIDGQSLTAPQTLSWTPGTSHTLAVISPQGTSSGALYAWANWSDGGAASHTVTAANTSTTYTANFNPLSTPPSSPTPPPVSGGSSLAGYWKLDEPSGAISFADASGNGHAGACGMACPTMGGTGKVGTAASFNGINSQIAIPDSPSLRLNQFTIALWVYPTQLKGNYQPLVVKEDSAGNNRNYWVSLLPNSTRIHVAVWAANCATKFVTDSAGQLALNTWNQVVFTFDGSVEKIYLNGVLDSSSPASTGSLCQAAVPVKIGAETAAFQPFSGALDDVQIYSAALSAVDVSNLYSPIAAYWKLDEPSGATAFADASGNGNTGSCSAGACPAMGLLGKEGTAGSFDGANDQITIPDSPSLRPRQFTIALWVNPRQVKSDYQPLLAKEDSSGNFRNYWLSLQPTSTRIHFAVWAADCATKFAGDSISQLGLNTWTHVALTYDGSKASIYINGTLEASVSASASLCQAAVPVKLGKETSAFQPFNGSLDDVRIYSQAMNATSVMNVYLNSLAGH